MKKSYLLSQLHLRVQQKIKRMIQDPTLKLEHAFAHRRADIFWEKEKLVFEIQCSFISLNEVKRRCRDYKKMGLEVVWILHEKTFNKYHCRDAELFLRRRGRCYYTNISQHGDGLVYDQEEALFFNKRHAKERIEINLGNPKRDFTGNLYFENDLTDLKLSRFFQFKKVWKKKVLIFFKYARIYLRYGYAYAKWRLTLG